MSEGFMMFAAAWDLLVLGGFGGSLGYALGMVLGKIGNNVVRWLLYINISFLIWIAFVIGFDVLKEAGKGGGIWGSQAYAFFLIGLVWSALRTRKKLAKEKNID